MWLCARAYFVGERVRTAHVCVPLVACGDALLFHVCLCGGVWRGNDVLLASCFSYGSSFYCMSFLLHVVVWGLALWFAACVCPPLDDV